MVAGANERVDRRGNPSGINVVGVASSLAALVDLVVAHTLRLWEIAQAASEPTLRGAARRLVFNEHESVPMHLLKERDVLQALPATLTELLAAALARLVGEIEHALRLAARADDPGGTWSLLVGRSALERALAAVDVAHAFLVRCIQLAVLLGPDVVRAKARSQACSKSKPLQRALAMRTALGGPSGFRLMLIGADVPPGARARLHFHSLLRIISGEDVLIEQRAYDPTDHNTLVHVRDTAVLLAALGHHSTAVLSARGFIPVPSARTCELVLTLPRGLGSPRTLRDLLLDRSNVNGARHPLAERVALARRLVRAVIFSYASSGVAHHAVSPENIICLFDDTAGADEKLRFPWTLGTVFLAGVDVRGDVHGMKGRDGEWWADLYRHPTRQGRQALQDLNLLHDIYSVGVVLLEVALWRSLVLIEERGQQEGPTGSPSGQSSMSQVSGRRSEERPRRPESPSTASASHSDGAEMMKRANSARIAAAALLGRPVPLPHGRPSTAPPSSSSSAAGRLRYRPNKQGVPLLAAGKVRDALDVQKALVRTAVESVPLALGERYRDAVLTCLNCLDGALPLGAPGLPDREFRDMVAQLRDIERSRSRGRTPDPEDRGENLPRESNVDAACAVLMRVEMLLDEIQL